MSTKENLWLETTLGEVVKLSTRRYITSDEPSQPYVGLEHIEPHTLRRLGGAEGNEIKSFSSTFAKGDILYSRMRPYLNKVWLAEFDGLCSPEFLVMSTLMGINNRFLAYRLAAKDFVDFADARTAGDRPRVSFDKLSQFRFSIPSKEQQVRIADKLDAVFQSLERAQVATNRATIRLSRLRQKIIEDAVGGDTTRDVRESDKFADFEPATVLLDRIRLENDAAARVAGDALSADSKDKGIFDPLDRLGLPSIPAEWIWVRLSSIGELSRGRSRHRPRGDAKLYGGNYPFIQTGDIRRSGGTITDHTQTYSEFGLSQSRLWPTGTLCITIAANIAETGILTYPACFPDSVVGLFQEPELVNLRFVEYYIRSQKDKLERFAPATAQKNINLNTLSDFAVPLAPLAEQEIIVARTQQRLEAADKLAAKIEAHRLKVVAGRRSVLSEAFAGLLTDAKATDSSPSLPSVTDGVNTYARKPEKGNQVTPPKALRTKKVLQTPITSTRLVDAARLTKNLTASKLFSDIGADPGQVFEFYATLKETPEVRALFERSVVTNTAKQVTPSGQNSNDTSQGRFRLLELWLNDFKNLKDYTASFGAGHGLDVVMGWNGTGKSNLFEALVIIFRDLHNWKNKNKWPDQSISNFRIIYEINRQLVAIEWDSGKSKRPEAYLVKIDEGTFSTTGSITRDALPLPRFVFGYYSGPTNRLAEHFLPMNQAHYIRLRDAQSDDPDTLSQLLEQRRFFCAETHHAKYVLLAFLYKEDADITSFLRQRLRIEGFESAIFVIRKPRWARQGATAEDFWGAKGVMRRVLERLRNFAVAPMVIEQTVDDGYRTAKEDHYYFFLPDLERLHAFAAEYANARAFFLALESTDFSELIYDVKVQVRVRSPEGHDSAITFREMSEGEQQLLTVLGLMRFTKSNQSLVLLDEPDTHLNPHWSVEYLKLLTNIMRDGDGSTLEQQSSQILISTHDPLVIASLQKDQVHLMRRDKNSGAYEWRDADVTPKGLGFTGILTSDLFGFRSDLDPETLADLDTQVRLLAREENLNPDEEALLADIGERLSEAGYQQAFSDPYYAAFVRAWGRKHADLMAGKQFLSPDERAEVDRVSSLMLEEARAEIAKGTTTK